MSATSSKQSYFLLHVAHLLRQLSCDSVISRNKLSNGPVLMTVKLFRDHYITVLISFFEVLRYQYCGLLSNNHNVLIQ